MAVTRHRSTRRSRNRRRKLILNIAGFGLLAAALAYWLVAELQGWDMDVSHGRTFRNLALGHAAGGIVCLLLRQLLAHSEQWRRARRRKRYEAYRQAYESSTDVRVPEDWEE